MFGTVIQLVREKAANAETKTVELIDYAIHYAELSTATQPHNDRIEHVSRKHNEWFQAEVKRGADLTTRTPDEVDNALRVAGQKRLAAALKVHAGVAPAMRAELLQLAADAEAKSYAAVEAMNLLRDRTDQANRFSKACGAPSFGDLRINDLEAFHVSHWAQRVRQVLNPPAPRPREKAADNRLVLD